MNRPMNRTSWTLLAALVVSGASLQSACSTNAFCFENCGDTSGIGDSGPDEGTGGTGGYVPDSGTGGVIPTPEGGDVDACVITNGGAELCDGLDNDCNGTTDEGFDLHDPQHCGTCSNNCFTTMINAELQSITCDWSGTANQGGTCGFTTCLQDWFDLDKDPVTGCEYPCVKTADDDTLCNNRDDNCNGLKDENVDVCTSVTDCGKCGGTCVVLHGTPTCAHPPQGPCDSTNTRCAIASCADDDNDGKQDWWDLDNSYATGCEYNCKVTNGGVEKCGDGLDNDCDGLLDGADPSVSADPQLGQSCFGDLDGICALPAHAGKTVCQGQAVVCVGADVLVQGQTPEICNGLDDDCDGDPDNNLTDVGKSCGTSNVFPCALGSEQCVNGALACVGAVEPGIEVCNGMDDDCDNAIDDNPTDAVGSCGQTDLGECALGTKVCTGGVVLCSGNIDAIPEICNGKDDDCDGQTDDNPTDQGGACGKSNTSPCKFGMVTCQAGALNCVGNLDPVPETCNGVDDNCNGTIDDNVPGAGASCGTNGTFPCKKGAMQCVNGAMLCVGAIEPSSELCNGQDDNCNGVIDDSTTDSGGSCGQSNTSPCKFGQTQCHNGALLCVGNVDPTIETCNGKDDNCNGTVDDNPSGVGTDCGQSNDAPCKFGTTQCQAGAIKCVGNVDPKTETCNGLDDNCNGTVDDSPTGGGASCGQSAVFPCSLGTMQCQSGALACTGNVDPKVEACNGVDDNCDGKIDLTGTTAPADATGACNVPAVPPAGATSPCKAGTKACVGGTVVCQGSVVASSAVDTCGVDANCDGKLTGQPDVLTDVHNCGACGNDCLVGAVHASWTCAAGACQFQACQTGYYDLNADKKCEYACTYIQAQEACNGQDDNCNGQTDEAMTAPSPVQVCGVSPAATRAECTTGVTVACQTGAWKCSFPVGVCTTGCSTTTETCDALDNNCNGLFNENVPNYGQACASDDGLALPGHGACRTTGTYVCNGASATKCSAVKADCTTLAGGCTETCDGIDNDCDGSVDETFNAKGTNATYFVKPTVTMISATVWVQTYEASRPSATLASAGSGNGYWTSAPTGQTLDKTPACSVASKVPWFNVTPLEVEQTCTAIGGAICTLAQWQTACRPNAACQWGYNPRGAAGSACATSYTATKFCNLGPSYDFSATTAGDQDGLLPTGSAVLQNCWADWSGLQGNIAPSTQLVDLTGNLREITKQGTNDYRLMGGAFNTGAEAGATCGFSFYSVTQDFKFFDTGFRCCFTGNPTL